MNNNGQINPYDQEKRKKHDLKQETIEYIFRLLY